MVYLQIDAGGESRRSELGDAPVQIGRIAGRNTLVLEDNLISRKHCIFNKVGDKYTVKDLDSSNGTYVNGERLSQIAILQTGDVISVGHCQIRFIDESQPPRAPEPQASAVPAVAAAGNAAEPAPLELDESDIVDDTPDIFQASTSNDYERR